MNAFDVQSTIDLILTIFIGMGPIKVLLVYLGATREADSTLQRLVARKTVVTATSIGLLLIVAGPLLMRLLHFTSGSLTIAGGLILLLLALQMVLSAQPAKGEAAGSVDQKALLSMAVFPMAIPLLLNPIGIVALTVSSAEATSLRELVVLVVIVVVVGIVDYAIFLTSHGLGRALTPERILLFEKVLGIMLTALAVQLIYNGLVELGVIAAVAHH